MIERRRLCDSEQVVEREKERERGIGGAVFLSTNTTKKISFLKQF